MVFFLFFLAWDLFFSQLRDLWDEGVLKSLNFNEKTALKLQVRASSPENYGPQFLHFLIRANQRANPIIAVRNLIIVVRNYLSRSIFHLIFFV
jgi:hypothetical protein